MRAEFGAALAADAEAVRRCLVDELAAYPDLPVVHAMRYALEGGKGLRGFLVLEGARLHGVPEGRAIWPAAAIEAMHCYSLIHDDLPAMDDDDMRRGRPTVHIAWDQATAILAGDAMQALAFSLAARSFGVPSGGVPSDGVQGNGAQGNAVAGDAVCGQLARTLAEAAGARGMVLGQALDMAAETAPTPLTLDQITDLQAGKTGALFGWAAMAGPRMAGADPAPMGAFAAALGLAFQIADDILDVTGTAAATGKRVGKDAAAGKATFVSLLGLEGARARAAALVEEAEAALAPYGAAADTLRTAARFVITREG